MMTWEWGYRLQDVSAVGNTRPVGERSHGARATRDDGVWDGTGGDGSGEVRHTRGHCSGESDLGHDLLTCHR